MKKHVKALGIILIISTCISCKEEPDLPEILTNNATNISTTSAVSGGIITDDGGAPVITKGICWSTTSDPTIDNNKTVGAGVSGSFSCNITDLSPGTIYYVRAYVANKAGISYGETKSFETLGEKPVSWSLNATNIQTITATLNGRVNPNSLETTITFEYGMTTSYGSLAAALQSPLSGDSDENVTADLTQLSPGTTYHFRVKAQNLLGITFSNDLTFITLGQIPLISTVEAKNIDLTSASLNGTVNPNSLETNITFEYGLTTSYGSSVAAPQSPLTGQINENITADLTGLNPGTTYHFRIKAENFLGTVYSADMTFTTPGQVPLVITCGAQNVTLNSATLNVTLNPNYLSTAVTFEWGISAAYGNTIYPVPGTVNGHDAVELVANITGLNTGTTYHYRIKATNLLGTTSSPDMVFSTNLADSEANIYRTVTIGTQLWMAENLRSTKYNDGSPISLKEDNDQWRTSTTVAYCWYNNDPGNKNVYGALYNWYAVDQSQNGFKNVCPSGWHVAKKSEWIILFDYLSQNGYGFGGNSQAIAKSLASTSGWEFGYSAGMVGNVPTINNTSGFNGFPGGLRMYEGTFSVFGRWGGWWAQPDAYMQGYSLWYNVITYDNSIVTPLGLGLTYGSSIRCIKN